MVGGAVGLLGLRNWLIMQASVGENRPAAVASDRFPARGGPTAPSLGPSEEVV